MKHTDIDKQDWKKELHDYLFRIWDIDAIGSVGKLEERILDMIDILLAKKNIRAKAEQREEDARIAEGKRRL